MQTIKRIMSLVFFLLISPTVFSANATNAAIEKLAVEWGQAIAERNPTKITDLYEPNAILYATFSNVVDTPKGILDYFTKLSKNQELKVVFSKQQIRLYGNAAINSGLYEFSYKDHDKIVKVPARYTFVYHETPTGKWLIIDHHSSVLPESAH